MISTTQLSSALVFGALLTIAPLLSKAQTIEQYDSRTIIVRGGPQLSLKRFHDDNGVQVKHTFTNLSGIQVLTLPPGLSVAAALGRYRQNPNVIYAEPNYIMTAATNPNDAAFVNGTLWNLNNPNDADIDAPEGWSVRTSANGIVVAVLDTGIRQDHPDLVPNLWTNPGEIANNGLDDDGNGYVDDVHGVSVLSAQDSATSPNVPGIEDINGHGTYVSGVIGARGNNEAQVPGGTVGVCWDVKLMTVKSHKTLVAGIAETTTEYIIKAIEYSIQMNADIINFSTAGSGSSIAVMEAIGRARDHGILFVTAAGNNSVDTDFKAVHGRYPACYDIDNIISVAATTRYDQLASYSNHGVNWIHLAAPGGDNTFSELIYTTGLQSYFYTSGTSLATPHVSGALALLKAQFPNESYLQLKNRLLSSTDPLTALAGKCQTSGRLNLHKMLTSSSSKPYNDSFGKALEIDLGFGWAPINLVGANVDATKEPGEPNHGGNVGGASIWWRWQAPSTTPLRVWTSGSGIDTVLAVYTGTSVNGLTLVAGNDDGGQNLTSQVTFTPIAGTTYYIAADGKNGAVGSIKLHLSYLQGAQAMETKFTLGSLQRFPGAFQGTVVFPPASSLVFEKSTDLGKAWGGVQVLVNGSGTYTFTDYSASEPSAIYRVRRFDSSQDTPIAEMTSVNVVGYSERTVPTGWAMVSTPFRNSSSALGSVLLGVTEGTYAYKWNQTLQTWESNGYVDGAWEMPTWTLEPGEGIALYNPSSGYTVKCLGEVVLGYRTTQVSSALCVCSSRVPEAGKLASLLDFPAAAGDKVHKMNASGTWSTFTLNPNGSGVWSPSEPNVGTGEAIFSEKAAALWWRRNLLAWP